MMARSKNTKIPPNTPNTRIDSLFSLPLCVISKGEGDVGWPQISSLLEGDIKSRMRPFCTADTSEEIFSSLSVGQLLDRNYCPPWWVESQQVLGRCLPSLAPHNTSDTNQGQ